jgi:hypothetical protein
MSDEHTGVTPIRARAVLEAVGIDPATVLYDWQLIIQPDNITVLTVNHILTPEQLATITMIITGKVP